MQIRYFCVPKAFLCLCALVLFTRQPVRAQGEPAPGATPVSTEAPVFNLGTYQESDGAIPLIHGRNRIDAYFATKALLTAHEAGLDIRSAGLKWIDWLLPRQKPDGRFERYKRTRRSDGTSVWKPVDIADADDALMALWIELLYTLAPRHGLPAAWQKSVWLAGDHLATLQDSRGFYYISRENRVGLLMDNVEIYGSLLGIARERVRLGHATQALQTALRAGKLGAAIHKTFWDAHKHRFSVSTQNIPDEEFYPHAVAQIYPLLAGLKTPTGEDKSIYDAWLGTYGYDWIMMKRDEFPWGLVAFLAWKQGDTNTARAWQVQNEQYRQTDRWTILDEAIYQSLDVRLPVDLRVPRPDPRLMARPEEKPVEKTEPENAEPDTPAEEGAVPENKVP